MAIRWRADWLVRGAAALVLAVFATGTADATEFQLAYNLTVNQGSGPFASLESSGALPAGTQLTLTAKFDTDTADQWNIGAYNSMASLESIVIAVPHAPPAFYTPLSAGIDYILLSDPLWETVGGPGPYSAGLFYLGGGAPGSINSVFGASTQTFDAADPSDTRFDDYQSSFYFDGDPFVVRVQDVMAPSPLDVLSIFDTSVSGATASIGLVPEPSTWAMLLIGFGGLGLAGYRRTKKRLPKLGAAVRFRENG